MSDTERSKSTVPLRFCEPGQTLAEKVRNPDGQVMVPEGKKLNEKLLRRLTAAGIRRVTIFGKPEEAEKETSEESAEEKSEGRENIIKETPEELVVSGDLTEDFEGDRDVVIQGSVQNGAHLESTGDIQVEGVVEEGTIQSSGGVIDIRGNVSGQNIELIAEKLIRLPSVEEAEVSVEGNVVVRGPVTGAEIECLGNMVIHHDAVKARVVDSQLRVEGKLLADEVDAKNSEGSELFFRDPKKHALRRRRKELEEKIETWEKEFSKLRKVVDTVKQLGDNVKELSDQKRKKLKEKMSRFKEVKEQLSGAREGVEECEVELEELKQERRHFMRVLETLRKNTDITMENSKIDLDDDEWDVQLYKKSMIVVQSVENLSREDKFDGVELLQ